MSRPPDNEKPVAVEATGFQKVEKLAGKFDFREDTETLRILQARALLHRFPLTFDMALALADHVHGRIA